MAQDNSLPAWKFGCLPRDSVGVSSLMRTVLTGSLPVPMFSEKGDTQAPLELSFTLDLDEALFGAWQQWVAYDICEGAVPFTIYIPWGTQQPRVRARLLGGWQAKHDEGNRWQVSGTIDIERESLPAFSGGVNPTGGI